LGSILRLGLDYHGYTGYLGSGFYIQYHYIHLSKIEVRVSIAGVFAFALVSSNLSDLVQLLHARYIFFH
jgi:hypothetical protein